MTMEARMILFTLGVPRWRRGWYRWFAWRPVLTDWRGDPGRQLVWLCWLERNDFGYPVYLLPEIREDEKFAKEKLAAQPDEKAIGI